MERQASIADFKAAATRRGSSVRLCTKYDPLLMAVGKGSLDGVRQVFAEGYDIKSMGEQANALHTAFEKNCMDIVRYLVKTKGVNIDTPNQIGRTLLHKACHRLDEELISELYDMGADATKVQEEDGYTPLHIVAEKGNVELVKALIDRGADPSQRTEVEDDEGEYPTPADLARKGGFTQCVEWLEAEMDPELLELKARKDKAMAKLAPNARKIVNNKLQGPSVLQIQKIMNVELAVIPSYAVCTNVQKLPITEGMLMDEFTSIDIDDNGWIYKEDFRRMYDSYENFGAPKPDFHRLMKNYNSAGADKLSFDEYCIVRLQVAQR